MASALFALSLVCLLSGRMAQADGVSATWSDPRAESFVSAKVGEDVTLPCRYEEDRDKWIYWFKQTSGQEAKVISSLFDKGGVFHGEFEHNSRFSLGTKDQKFPLKIKSVELSDSATYLCLKPVHGEVALKGVSLHVWGSALSIRASLHPLASESLHPGGSLNLNCQVPAEVQRHPQARNYICSVASCAHSENRSGLDFGVMAAGVLAVVLVAVLAVSACVIRKRRLCNNNEPQTGFPAPSTTHDEEIQDSDKMYFLALLGGGRGDQTRSKCVYYNKKQQ